MNALLEIVCTETVIVVEPARRYQDGKPLEGASRTVRARKLGLTSRDIRDFGRIDDGSVFLIAGDYVPPVDATIRTRERDYHIARVRECRDLEGAVIASRCAVV